jgi:serine/threonine-protein phosphatase 2A regulatory subunit B''
MDYKAFLDFVLAMENKKTPQALQYYWKILDVYHKGAVDSFVVNMFFKDVVKKLNSKDQLPYIIEDVIDEIFDMCKPKVKMGITFEDL